MNNLSIWQLIIKGEGEATNSNIMLSGEDLWNYKLDVGNDSVLVHMSVSLKRNSDAVDVEQLVVVSYSASSENTNYYMYYE